MMGGFAAILRKDLTLELRTGQSVIALAVLSLLILVVLVLAVSPLPPRAHEVAAGALWVALLFAGLLGATRSLAAEYENGAIAALLMSPVEPATIYAAKLAAAALFMILAEIATLVLMVLFFNLEVGAPLLRLCPIVVLGVVGFAAVSTLLAAVSNRTRAANFLLPVLVVPLFVPAIIGGVRASTEVLSGATLGDVSAWLKVLCAFDVLFVVAGYLLFEYVTGED